MNGTPAKPRKGLAVRIREQVRLAMLRIRHAMLRKVYGMQISPSARVSLRARLDKTHPGGIVIGDESYVASGAVILAHDFCRGIDATTVIGKRCFIGTNAIVLPGVRIGDAVIVGAAAVVTRDVPAGSIVAGNPARVIRRGIRTDRYGRLVSEGTGFDAAETEGKPEGSETR